MIFKIFCLYLVEYIICRIFRWKDQNLLEFAISNLCIPTKKDTRFWGVLFIFINEKNQIYCDPATLAVAAERVCTSSFSKMDFRCRLTVFVVITNFSAISLLVSPCANNSSTSLSRSVRALSSLCDWCFCFVSSTARRKAARSKRRFSI